MKIAIIGEPMLELRLQGGHGSAIPYGGDTLNTAIHLARLGHHVSYMTAVGVDPASDALVAAWRSEGIDTEFVLRHPERQPGIYAIHVDEVGERSFLYWRDQSAARALFDLGSIADACDAIADVQLLYFSHVSLAILPSSARQQMLDLARTVRARGGMFAYDSNFRPRLWPDRATAAQWSTAAMAVASVGLPTADDERALHAHTDSDETIATDWLRAGVQEVAVKIGAQGCILASGDDAPRTLPCSPLHMVDSSGAGDAFNAAYLSARLYGQSPAAAAQAGHALAGWVIQRSGALPSPDADAPYRALGPDAAVS